MQYVTNKHLAFPRAEKRAVLFSTRNDHLESVKSASRYFRRRADCEKLPTAPPLPSPPPQLLPPFTLTRIKNFRNTDLEKMMKQTVFLMHRYPFLPPRTPPPPSAPHPAVFVPPPPPFEISDLFCSR